MQRFAKTLLIGLVSLVLMAGLVTIASGCGEEKKPLTEAQIADINEPASVYVVTSYEADVKVPSIAFNTDAMSAWALNEVLSGRLGSSEEEITIGLLDELLAHPANYVVAGATDNTSTRTVAYRGNGYIISPDGYVITNAHLVKGNDQDTKDLFAKDAATDALLSELDKMETDLGFTLTDDERSRFFDAAAQVIATYMTVSDVSSKTQVYTGNLLDKARKDEEGLSAEQVKVGDSLDIKKETGKDVAILKVNATNLPTVHLGDDAGVRDGDRIDAVTFFNDKAEEASGQSFLPNEDKPSLVTGTIAGIRKMKDGWNVLQMQIPLKVGTSGSAIYNSNGEVIGMMTFVATDTQASGDTQELEAQKYAIPVSIIKEFMGLANVSASEGTAGKMYREGVDLFAQQHYSAAKAKFEEVKSTNADFPFIQDFISESQDNINRGQDKGTFPTTLVLILVAIAVVVVAAVLILVLVIMPRSKKKGQGPGAGMPGGPMPPTPGGPMPGQPAAPMMPGQEAPTATMPAPAMPAAEPAAPEAMPGAPAGAPSGEEPAGEHNFCSKCGTTLDPDSQFCSKCGNPVK